MTGLAQHESNDESLAPAVIAVGFARAYDAARRFYGATAPNPPVGCVALDKKGAIIGVGAHEKAGTPHAEVMAIADAEQRGRIDDVHTLIVTLEPCNHCGRTPPCSLKILQTRAQTIWIGRRDANPHVDGGGAERLKAEGRNVRWLDELAHPDRALLRRRMAALVAPFEKMQQTGTPFVVVKQALDENGSMIPPEGQKTFTSATSLRLAHVLRKRSDAIVTGSGTVLADDPSFTVRHLDDFEDKKRTLVIVDRRGRVPQRDLDKARARGFDVWVRTDFHKALKELAEAGHLQVLIEAGPGLLETVRARRSFDLWVRIQKDAAAENADRVIVSSPEGPVPNYEELPCFQE